MNRPCSPESICSRCASVTHSAFTAGLCALLGLLCVVGACARQRFTPDEEKAASVGAETASKRTTPPKEGQP